MAINENYFDEFIMSTPSGLASKFHFEGTIGKNLRFLYDTAKVQFIYCHNKLARQIELRSRVGAVCLCLRL